jgi:transposase
VTLGTAPSYARCRAHVRAEANHLGGITLLFLPPYAPELNPKENLWDEIREKIFKNYALKSIDAVYAKLNEAI